jgi:hypothetical protein
MNIAIVRRVASETAGESVVEHGHARRDEHGHARRDEHAPARRDRQHRCVCLALPGTQEIALPQQLGAEAPLDADSPNQQPADHKQADALPSASARCDSGHRPLGTTSARAMHSRLARARYAGGNASASSGSSSSTRDVKLMGNTRLDGPGGAIPRAL